MSSFLVKRKRPFYLAGAGGALLLAVWAVVPADGPPANPNSDLAQIEKWERQKDLDALAKAAGHQDPRVAARAVNALASVAPGEQARAAVTQALKDPRAEVRQAAAGAWPQAFRGAGGLPSLPSPLLPAMKDASAGVRAAAVRAAGKALCFDVLPYLIAALDDPDRSVRESAVRALEEYLSLKFDSQYSPDDPQPKRRHFAARMTEFTNRPAVRTSLADWRAELARRRQQRKESVPP
jgi:hypothetical protein